MAVLRIEHAVSDYDSWKKLFDSDPADRRGSGVREYRIHRPVDDAAFVTLDLELATAAEAEALLATLQGIWQNAIAAGTVTSQPAARVLETVESATL